MRNLRRLARKAENEAYKNIYKNYSNYWNDYRCFEAGYKKAMTDAIRIVQEEFNYYSNIENLI